MNATNKTSKPRKSTNTDNARFFGEVTARQRHVENLNTGDYVSDMGLDQESFSHNAFYSAMWR